MILQDYVNDWLDEGETNAVILGLQNGVRSNLADALKHVPEEDWHAEISRRQKETDGQTLIWLAGRADPSYSIPAIYVIRPERRRCRSRRVAGI